MSNNQGLTFSASTLTGTSFPVAFSHQGVLYTASSTAVFQSVDSGASFSVATAIVDPTDLAYSDGLLIVASGKFYRFKAGFMTELTNGLSGNIRTAASSGQILVAGGSEGIFLSQDSGASFSPVPGTIKTMIHQIRIEDTQSPRLIIYAGSNAGVLSLETLDTAF